MNIFLLDSDPVKASQYLDNRRVNKMATETAQILCTVAHHLGAQNVPWEKARPENHPVILWAEKSKENFEWTLRHGQALIQEHYQRTGRDHVFLSLYPFEVHASAAILDWIEQVCPRPKSSELTPFVQCLPDCWKQKDSVEAYRNAFVHEKLAGSWYENCHWPIWLQEKLYIAMRDFYVSDGYGTNFDCSWLVQKPDRSIFLSSTFEQQLYSYFHQKLPTKKSRILFPDLIQDFNLGPSQVSESKENSNKMYYWVRFVLCYFLGHDFFPGFSYKDGKKAGVIKVV